jgi:type IV pilus assembly protein PilE
MSRGITLVELLVVLVIVGILAVVTVPTYRGYVLRVNRTEAMIALLELQTAEESFFMRNRRYVDDITGAPPAGLGLPLMSTSGKYNLSVAMAADGQTYIASATPVAGGGQEADEDCLAFSVDARGRHAVSGSRDARYCWK